MVLISDVIQFEPHGHGLGAKGEIPLSPYQVAEKVIFLRLLKNAQMQGPPAFAEAASRRQANILRPKN